MDVKINRKAEENQGVCINFGEVCVYRIIMRTFMHLESTGRKNSFERFPYLGVLAGRLTEEKLKEWRQCETLEAKRYRDLIIRINGKGTSEDTENMDEDVLRTMVDLCLAVMYVPEFAAYLNHYTGNTVTVQLAFEMEGTAWSSYGDTIRILKKIGRICQVDWKKKPISWAAVEGDGHLLAYLTGKDGNDKAAVGQMQWFEHRREIHPMFIRQELAKEGAVWIKEQLLRKSKILFHISGRGGRRFLVKHTARLMKRDVLFVDMETYMDSYLENEECFWGEMIRAAFFQEAAVCIHGVTTELLSRARMKERDFLEKVVWPFLEADIPVFLCSDAGVEFEAEETISMHRIDLGETTRQEREAVFTGLARLYHIPADCKYLSVRCLLSASEAAKAARIWSCGGGSNEEEFVKICSRILLTGQERPLGKVIYPSTAMEDLKAPVSVKEVLRQICTSVREGYRIFEEWGLRQLYPYGRAVTVLVAGPPGTGKTMTAHVIAKELCLPLYQVDLSNVMDKYIGETEKHLEQIFTFAEKTNPVLFFDEADSLFGKRGEAADGKDRYANMEVSYLLQRIEQFEGVVILATNFYNNIDKAFLRRMKYVLKYEAPDREIRKSIWESCLPPKLPREELDMDYLAGQFDLTGGMIKNVVYLACVMAVHEGKTLCMEYILKAVRAEYQKTGRLTAKDMWGEYGFLMDQGSVQDGIGQEFPHP